MADVKYALDDNAKQNFLEPLHHLQSKDLKEVMVSTLPPFLNVLYLRCLIPFSTGRVESIFHELKVEW